MVHVIGVSLSESHPNHYYEKKPVPMYVQCMYVCMWQYVGRPHMPHVNSKYCKLIGKFLLSNENHSTRKRNISRMKILRFTVLWLTKSITCMNVSVNRYSKLVSETEQPRRVLMNTDKGKGSSRRV